MRAFLQILRHFDNAPYFAPHDRASNYAKASSFAIAMEDRTPDKPQGEQGRQAHHL
ncbi:MAG: hypothetical protein MUP16_02995 [Sedimentisphaerales bacterium]|nr:hypothetical protein [Sedimentisphaerales bacterium]